VRRAAHGCPSFPVCGAAFVVAPLVAAVVPVNPSADVPKRSKRLESLVEMVK
jgi:hypothetical protein